MTGASSGIGRALSLRLAAAGARLAVAARRLHLLAELAAASLVTTLRVAVALEPAQGLPEEARDALLARISELERPGSSLTNPG